MSRATPRVGEQFELDLFPGVPWNGRAPRGLTRGRSALFLRQEPPGHGVSLDSAQLSLWLEPGRLLGKEGSRRGAGASLLVDVKRVRRTRRSRFMRLLR